MNKADLEKYLPQSIDYHVVFSRVSGGVTAGVFLSYLLHLSSESGDPRCWIEKTQAEWEQETDLTRRNQETARKQLRERGIIEEKLAGIPARLHYRINFDRLSDLLAEASPQPQTAWQRRVHLLPVKRNELFHSPRTDEVARDRDSLEYRLRYAEQFGIQFGRNRKSDQNQKNERVING